MKYNEDKIKKLIDTYLNECSDEKHFPTKNGICIKLDITRETYNRWKKKSDTLKKAEIVIEQYWTDALPDKKYQVAGVIFYLKNAFGWRDSQSLDVTSGGKPIPLMDFRKK